MPFIASITFGFANVSYRFIIPLTAEASRLPIAPSNVVTDVAASFAMSVIPILVIACPNRSAVMAPSSIAPLKSFPSTGFSLINSFLNPPASCGLALMI